MNDEPFLTVSELLELLKDAPPDALVVLQKDAEGNGYSPCAGVETENAVYEPYTSWRGEVKYARLTETLRSQLYTDADVGGPHAVPCVVLFPVN